MEEKDYEEGAARTTPVVTTPAASTMGRNGALAGGQSAVSPPSTTTISATLSELGLLPVVNRDRVLHKD